MKLRVVGGEWEPVPVVFAIDPGLCTGWAIWVQDGDVSFGQQDETLPFADQAWEVLNTYHPEVVCESFNFVTGRAMDAKNYSLELIGTLRWMAHKIGLPFTLQAPSKAKAFATDQKLKVIGWHEPTKANGGHARDAARHLLTYLVTERKDPLLLEKLVAAL